MTFTSETYRILYAEDDEILAGAMTFELTEAGFAVTRVENGEKAISAIESQKFDIALLDIEMPRVDGFEVLNFIKKNYPDMKVIIVTGYADLANAVKAKKFGADAFVEKPLDLEDLFSTIDRVLNRYILSSL